jgi:alkanesulfonate monooxygenase SsuD/methylene tetrahydromethanopterin reductase-like flavin-dependent oxidoreductase (luciferase family)
VPFDDAPGVLDNVRQACEQLDRDPATLTMSAALVACAGAREADVERRAAALGREPAELRENGLAGSPEELADKIGRYGEIGVTRFYLQILDLADLDHLAHLGATLPR